MKNLLLLGLFFGLIAPRGLCQPLPHIIVDEYGSGYVWDQMNNSTNNLTSTLGPDPTGGLLNWNVLIYNLPQQVGGFPLQYAAGDVLVRDLFEPGAPILDVIRFDGNGHMIFYSDSIDGFNEPADTPGPPDPFLPNQIFENESVNGSTYYIDYTPNANNPGFVMGPNVSYFFVSDGHVPEPSAGALLLVGAVALGFRKARKKLFAHKSLIALLLLAGVAMRVQAGDEAPPPEIGLRIGDHAPNFTLKDQNGKDVSLDALLKQGPVAVVFYRSADWCLFCKFEWIHLQRNLKEFQATGGHVVGVSYDSVRILKRFADNQKITLPLLSDQGSKTIDAYGVRDQSADESRAGFAAHATFVLDQKGIIRAKLLKVIYQEQPGVGFLVKALKDARTEEQKS